MLRFVRAEFDPIGQKRKQSQRACDECRRKKKACKHQAMAKTSQGTVQQASSGATGNSSPPPTFSASTAVSSYIASGDPRSTPNVSGTLGQRETERPPKKQKNLPSGEVANQGEDQNHSTLSPEAIDTRFIGDLNPESVLRAATSHEETQSQSPSNSIGIWLTEKLQDKSLNSGRGASADQPPTNLFYGFLPVVQRVLVPILEQECLGLLPPSAHLDALCSFYFEKMNTIIPVIERRSFQDLPPESAACILLKQAICLAASMNSSSKQHLYFSDGGPLQGHRDFAKRLLSAMRTSIELGFVTSRIVIVRALTLMSLFTDGPDGRELSSQLCGRAVHYVHSGGLHIQGHCHDRDEDDTISLLCCVWALDRITAAIQGRPVLMHDRDMGRNMQKCFEQQQPCFRLFLRIITILDKLIQLYRPGTSSEHLDLESQFPSFEDLLVECGGLQIATPLIVSQPFSFLFSFHDGIVSDRSYLATVEMLYHAVAILSCRHRSSEAVVSSTPASVRRALSALRVTLMAEHEFHSELILLPFVPYAVSLSLSVAYREMRHNKISMYRMRARAQLRTNCEILEELGEIFWSAGIMADMGKATLKEFDRVYSTVANVQEQRRHGQEGDGIPGGRAVNGTDEPGGSSNRETTEATNTVSDGSSSAPNVTSVALPDFDPSADNSLPGLNIFDMFHADFDLSGIDACLQGNLDLSFPTNLH